MQKRKYLYLISCTLAIFLALIAFVPNEAFSWGFYSHKNINREAVSAVPSPIDAFFRRVTDYLTQHSVDPDKRRFVDSAEAPHHFIDIDHYGSRPFESLPLYWSAAEKKYSADTLTKYGTLPWAVLEWETKLTNAFKKMDATEIMKAAAYLGHYVADAHVPLHTVSNYNGQKSEQDGVHALWESAIPEAFGNGYKYFTHKAAYIKNPEERIWEIIRESYKLAPSVLSAEKSVRASFNVTEIYTDKLNHKYTAVFIAAYNKSLNGMVEKQLQESVLDVAAFWYTAWVNGGQPEAYRLMIK